jgi:hypothetical protein
MGIGLRFQSVLNGLDIGQSHGKVKGLALDFNQS